MNFSRRWLPVCCFVLWHSIAGSAAGRQQAWLDAGAVVAESSAVELPIEPGSVPLFESTVAFIDSALPLTQFRFRYDANYNAARNTRAEYLLAMPQPIGRGMPADESRLDLQRATTYFEFAPGPTLSGFVEIGSRIVDPEINANSAGIEDMNFGFKWAFWWTEHRVFTAQLKAFLPTGDADRGLGVGHSALEPGFLLMHRITDRFRMEKHVKLWIPIDGAEGAAGSVAHYGISTCYDVVAKSNLRIAPQFELDCWTALGGSSRYLTPAGVLVDDAHCDTIWNAMFGCRVCVGPDCRHQFYAGYGRALTGETWFQDVARIEYRLAF